jgi:amidase
MLDVPFRSARQLARDIRAKKIGCLELLDLYLARVEKYDGALNAIVVRDVDRARTRARAADRALAKRQPWGPLHGVPMTIKESYDVAGLPTTWGVPAYARTSRPERGGRRSSARRRPRGRPRERPPLPR